MTGATRSNMMSGCSNDESDSDMPSVSAKQKRFMQAVAHSPAFAKKVGVPTKVGKDFAKADKAKKPADKPAKARGVKK